MLIWAMIAAGTLVALLVALKGFAAAKARPPKPVPRSGMVYETGASKIHEYVTGAEDWWQHLKGMPVFWVACFFSAIIVGLDYQFGLSRYPNTLVMALVIGSLFAAADVAIPFIAIKSELSPKRDHVATGLIWLFTLMSLVVVVGSTAEVSTTAGARTDVGVSSYQDDMKLLALKQAERDSIPMNRGFSALDELAKATEEAATREGGRVKCGPNCEKLKTEAKDLRAQANEAKRKETLTGEIEALKLKRAGGSTSDTRLDVDPLASAVEAMSGGNLSKDGVRKYGLTVLGVLLVVGVTLVWLQVGVALREEIDWELAHRGEIADATRANLGLPPRYTQPEPTALIAGPNNRTDAAEAGITINVAADMRRRFSNDADLLETDGLFGKLMTAADGGSVTFAALYKAYQVAILTDNPNAKFMTLPTMAQKLMTISQYRDDVRVTADGIIQGWILKPIDQRKSMENVNVV